MCEFLAFANRRVDACCKDNKKNEKDVSFWFITFIIALFIKLIKNITGRPFQRQIFYHACREAGLEYVKIIKNVNNVDNDVPLISTTVN